MDRITVVAAPGFSGEIDSIHRFGRSHDALLSARQVRSLVLTFWFFGLCLLSGCGSGDSGGSGASGAESARMKKFEEIKAKNAAAKQSKK